MSNSVKNTFIFVVGAAIGASVAWKLLKTKYEQLAQEEIDSAKEAFQALADRKLGNNEQEKQNVTKVVDKNDYEKMTRNYNECSIKRKDDGEEEEESMDKPYLINPREFGMIDDYDTITLMYYYADDILADEDGEIIEDVGDVVGSDYSQHFGEYEDDVDTVYIRNDVRKTDYEILLDLGKYSDVIKRSPHRVED